jgi:ATP-dependent exoDNAse (exonuclease V) alpha subunit
MSDLMKIDLGEDFNTQYGITTSNRKKTDYTPSITFTPDQQVVFDTLCEFITSDDDRKFFVLEGFAGCGKTTIVKEFMDWYGKQQCPEMESVVLCAPTHKALKVMRKMVQSIQSNDFMMFATIHSLLGITPYIDHDGKEVFKRNQDIEIDFSTFNIILIDESSMVDDYLFKELYNHAKQCDVKMIFVGDPKQIPPINHNHSMPMTPVVQEKLGFVKGELTTIVRQAEDNPIIKLSSTIRNTDDFAFQKRVDHVKDGFGVYHMDISSDKKGIYKKLNSVFNTETFAENPDHAKVIAWTNNTVKHFNNAIRALIYGKDAPKIRDGEKMILKRPVIVSKTVLANNNEDITVLTSVVTTMKLEGKDLKYYLCRVRNERDETFQANIIHEESEKEFDKILERLSNYAKSQKGHPRSVAWRKYYDAYDTFLYADYNYAITCHRSQGSTYDIAFVIYTDIMNNRKPSEKNRILYTAVTRPRETLYII